MLHVNGYLIRSMSSLYDRISAYVRLSSRVREYFGVRRELRQGCVISPWLSNVFFDRVVGQVNELATGRREKLRDGMKGVGK